jgi:hypothetical protein
LTPTPVDKDKRDNTISVLKAENRRMKRQIEMLKRYITHAESMATVIAFKENKESMLVTAVKQTVKKNVKCPHCKEGEIKTCQMHQKLYHRCQNCKKTWYTAATAT